MQLVDCEIKDSIDSGLLRITPFTLEQINPNTYDVRLGDEFIFYDEYGKTPFIDPYDANSIEHGCMRYIGPFFIIQPQQFVLARTIEHIKIPACMCAVISGKSSVARLGVSIHQTGGFIDSGFEGTITLELLNSNCRPVKLYEGMRIAQIAFYPCSNPCKPYNVRNESKYMNQIHAEISRYDRNEKPQ